VLSEYDGLDSGEEFSWANGPLGFVPRYTKYPVTLEVLLRSHVSATVWLLALVATPVPESAIFRGELAALLVIVSVPVRLPAALGSKFTV